MFAGPRVDDARFYRVGLAGAGRPAAPADGPRRARTARRRAAPAPVGPWSRGRANPCGLGPSQDRRGLVDRDATGRVAVGPRRVRAGLTGRGVRPPGGGGRGDQDLEVAIVRRAHASSLTRSVDPVPREALGHELPGPRDVLQERVRAQARGSAGAAADRRQNALERERAAAGTRAIHRERSTVVQ
jgi:hypothetical protein